MANVRSRADENIGSLIWVRRGRAAKNNPP
jgi:hypothetical protein